jgi:4-diphosphocytidyl-2C-methyl-D-erythritol kinase
MEIKAYGKINLSLNVQRRREDGYHDLDMIMAPISLHDTIDITISSKDTFSSNIFMEFDEENTVCKAIALMRKHFNIREHFCIHLTKNIPMQAGLAGGSSDGAAMLIAINELCNLHLSEDILLDMALKIGADVPFCLKNQICRVGGIGEHLKPIATTLNYHVLLVKPKTGVSTKAAYENIDFQTCIHPNIEEAYQRLCANDDTFVTYLGNTLEASAMHLNKEIIEVKQKMQTFPFDCVMMSGSGSCVFALSKDLTIIKQAKTELEKEYEFVEACMLLNKKVR